MVATRRPPAPRSKVRTFRAAPGAGRVCAVLAALLGGLLAAPFAHGQAADDPEAEVRARVAAAFPDAGLVLFRKIRPIPAEAGPTVAFCGQVSSGPAERGRADYHLFLYDRTDTAETVRILGSESLNGYRVGRKLIGALRRVGCL
ncbi:hypothetical protein [Methylobacterium radiotolerans]|uniref:hypothetical protein n=1 Tax=Methylobacterium radiotolerans TaxID=31998 RepID=UPI001F35CB2F|nr:hypothetical protein [Methylobacterium radiotolerans]UIY41561.1 hypothetical protein LZ599_24700 [Methylobacterium radiotolerans]